MAILLFYSARRMLRLTIQAVWTRLGLPEPVPPLHRVSLMVLGAVIDPERVTEIVEVKAQAKAEAEAEAEP